MIPPRFVRNGARNWELDQPGVHQEAGNPAQMLFQQVDHHHAVERHESTVHTDQDRAPFARDVFQPADSRSSSTAGP